MKDHTTSWGLSPKVREQEDKPLYYWWTMELFQALEMEKGWA